MGPKRNFVYLIWSNWFWHNFLCSVSRVWMNFYMLSLQRFSLLPVVSLVLKSCMHYILIRNVIITVSILLSEWTLWTCTAHYSTLKNFIRILFECHHVFVLSVWSAAGQLHILCDDARRSADVTSGVGGDQRPGWHHALLWCHLIRQGVIVVIIIILFAKVQMHRNS